MKIGIIVAMRKELDLLLPLLEDMKELTVDGRVLFTGRLGHHELAVEQCGIGKVNAAVGALELIQAFLPDLVINTGVAGGTGSDARVLDVVLASGVAYHDVWCGPETQEGEVQGLPRVFLPGRDVEPLAKAIGAKTGLVVSGDIFVCRMDDFRRIMALWPQAAAIDMESGAIAQVCHLKGVPFLCARVISDTPGEADNAAQYADFWERAPREAFSALQALLQQL